MKWWKADSISNESILAGMKMANNGQTSWRWQRQRVYLKSLDKGAYEHGVNMDFSPPGKLADKPFIESFNGSLRDECLNIHWFLSLCQRHDV